MAIDERRGEAIEGGSRVEVLDGVELYRYLDSNGSFDYEKYVNIQSDGNRRKINNIWVIEENVLFLSEYIRQTVGSVKFGLCHGTRRGKEQEWFRKYLGCEVIGTEISDTATDFPYTIQWDFHEVKPEWENAVDFVYSNSFDHAYDPKKCLRAWMQCLRPEGVCIIEHTSDHEKATELDPFGARISRILDLISAWGEGEFLVREVLQAPVRLDFLDYSSFIVVRRL